MSLFTSSHDVDQIIASKYEAFISIEQKIISELYHVFRKIRQEASSICEYFQSLQSQRPGCVPFEEKAEALSLVIECLSIIEAAEYPDLEELIQKLPEFTKRLSVLSRLAVRRMRVCCMWQAAGVSPVLMNPNWRLLPRYLFRAQVKGKTEGRCCFQPEIGVVSARTELTLPRDLFRLGDKYQQHLRFHCNGWYIKRGPTSWISCSDQPTWIAGQIEQDNYGWRASGHQIACIDVQKLILSGIPFAAASQLVKEAALTPYDPRSHVMNPYPPWDVVLHARDNHWLIFDWIPADCITWITLDDFVGAHDAVQSSVGYLHQAEGGQIVSTHQAMVENAEMQASLHGIANVATALGELSIARDTPTKKTPDRVSIAVQTEDRSTSDNKSTQTQSADHMINLRLKLKEKLRQEILNELAATRSPEGPTAALNTPAAQPRDNVVPVKIPVQSQVPSSVEVHVQGKPAPFRRRVVVKLPPQSALLEPHGSGIAPRDFNDKSSSTANGQNNQEANARAEESKQEESKQDLTYPVLPSTPLRSIQETEDGRVPGSDPVPEEIEVKSQAASCTLSLDEIEAELSRMSTKFASVNLSTVEIREVSSSAAT